jgi:hypothetical protein
VSPSSEVFGPPLFTNHNITVTNIGTDYLIITGVNNPNTFDWNATITPVTLAINQTATLQIMQKTTTAQTAIITVLSNANGGSGAVTVMGTPTKIMTITPSSYTYPAFTGTSTSATFAVGNSGNQPLTVSSVSNTNGKFAVSPTSFVVAPGSTQTVTVTYTPTDFSANSSTITFNSDKTSGTSVLNVTATRTQLYQAGLSQSSLTVKPSSQTPQLFLTNTGNIDVTVNSISNSNTTNFTVTWYKYQSSAWVPVTLPYTFAPGVMMMIQAQTAQSGNYSGATGTATVFMSQGTNPSISLIRATF